MFLPSFILCARYAEAFYCWLEDRPMPPWQIALSMMMAVVVMSLCLFPLAPYKLRLAVVYFFLGLLGVIFSLIAIRVLLFLLVFTVSGTHLAARRIHCSV